MSPSILPQPPNPSFWAESAQRRISLILPSPSRRIAPRNAAELEDCPALQLAETASEYADHGMGFGKLHGERPSKENNTIEAENRDR